MSSGLRARAAGPLFRAAAVGFAVLALVVVAQPAAAGQAVQLDTAGPGTAVGLWISRLLNHVLLAATVGLLVLPAWIVEDDREVGRRALRLATVAAALWGLAALAVLVFGLSNAAARPLPEAINGDLLSRFLGTRFGGAIALQALAAGAVVFLAALARGRRGAVVALCATLLAALGPAWWGHAGTAEQPFVAVLSDWLHISAASVWVGGLLALTALVFARVSPLEPFAPTERFSGLAGWAIGLVAFTGVVNTVMHTSSPEQLLETTWGLSALAKALLLLALAGFGWAHRRRSIPRLRRAGQGTTARRAFARLAGVELVVMLGAFGLATSMASGLPADAEAAARIQTFTAETPGGLVEVTLDPAETGGNELHLYIYDTDRRLRPVDDASVRLRSGDVEVEPRMVRAGPGHFTGPSVEVPSPGAWEVSVRFEVDGGVEEGSGTIAVR